MSNEHVFPQWLLKELQIEKNKISMGSVYFGMTGSQRNMDFASFVNGRICECCNNGWMSKLEIDVAPHITNLMNFRDVETELRWIEGNAETLAKWVLKTCFVLNDCTNYRRIVPNGVVNDLYNGLFPNATYVGMMFSCDDSPVRFMQSQGGFLMNCASDEIASISFHFGFIIKIKNVVFVVRGVDAHQRKVHFEKEKCISIYPEFGSPTSFKDSVANDDVFLELFPTAFFYD